MHISVLLKEVISSLHIKPNGLYLDATFGAGGYSRSILDHGGRVVAIDRDPAVCKTADEFKSIYGDRFEFFSRDFGSMNEIQFCGFDGIVFDLGVSSMQLDQEHRGFSFQSDAPLDMRMDSRQTLTAEMVVNTLSETQLADLIYHLGGEKRSRAIAKHIVEQRHHTPIHTTLKLAKLVEEVVGKYNDKIHPATRTFQAIRMYVNDELGQLRYGLENASNMLKSGGIMCVVAFHSGEDEIVKEYFKQLCGPKVHVNKYAKNPNQLPKFEYVVKLHPSRAEVLANPRSRSAILRAIRKNF